MKKYKLIGEIFPLGSHLDGTTIWKTIFEGSLDEIERLIKEKINEGVLDIDCHGNLYSLKIKETNEIYIQDGLRKINPVKEFNLTI